MPSLQEEIAAMVTAHVPVSQPQTQPVVTSVRTVGLTMARQVTDDVTLQNAQVAVQTGPRDANGAFIEDASQIKNFITDGAEAYNTIAGIMHDLVWKDKSQSAYVQSVFDISGHDISGMSFTASAPFIKIADDRKKASRLAAATQDNEEENSE